jgi:hypothetical protein
MGIVLRTVRARANLRCTSLGGYTSINVSNAAAGDCVAVDSSASASYVSVGPGAVELVEPFLLATLPIARAFSLILKDHVPNLAVRRARNRVAAIASDVIFNFLRCNSSFVVRQSAVRALYSTGSGAAVPVLIERLRSPEERISGTAEFGLQVLMHRRATEPNSETKPATTYARWTHGGTLIARTQQYSSTTSAMTSC